MLISSDVIFKGTRNGLAIIIKEGLNINKILEEIENKITVNRNFFTVDNLKISFKGKKLTEEEEKMIIELISEKTNISVEKDEQIMETLQKEKEFYNRGIMLDNRNVYEFCEGKTKYYQGTLRSGQSINYDGNIVILGDLNAGSELICTGNVVAFGCIRGVVHAGAAGDENAVVVALGLQPVQLRIAGIITRSPEGQVNAFNPEIAYIKDDSIFIETIDTRVKF